MLDADKLARSLIETDEAYIAALIGEFGAEIADEHGAIECKKLGALIFADSAKRLRFNEIAFPVIGRAIQQALAELRGAGAAIAVLDAPTLFESGAHTGCDIIISVTAQEGVRLGRIMARDGLSRQLAQDRIHSQHPDRFYTERSHFVLDGGAPLQSLQEQARALGKQLLAQTE